MQRTWVTPCPQCHADLQPCEEGGGGGSMTSSDVWNGAEREAEDMEA